MSKKILKLTKKIIQYWMFISSALIILTAVTAFVFYAAAYMTDEISFDSTGRAVVDFRVFYMDNPVWEENPIPQDVFYLKSLTDFIEIDSGFTANFGSDPVNIYYEYTARERLVIRYMSVADGNLNPVMFQETWVLSEKRGSDFANRLRFPRNNGDGPGGTYTITPRPRIQQYLDFAAFQLSHMQSEGLIAQGIRGFSAELFIEFTYTVRVPELGIYQTVMQGYRLSLSTEVYSFVVVGNPAFTQSINVTVQNLPFEFTFPVIVLFVGALALSFYGMFSGIMRLKADPNENRRRVSTIIKKYSNEVAVSVTPLDLSEYKIMEAEDFEQLLKMAINMSKQVLCSKNEQFAEFAVITESFAYRLRINYFESAGDDDFDVEDVEIELIEEIVPVETE